MADSFLSGLIEVFQQPDKPPTCGSKQIMYVVDRRCRPGLSTACIIIFFSFEKELLSEFVGHHIAAIPNTTKAILRSLWPLLVT